MSHTKFMVSGSRDVVWADVVELARSCEVTSTSEELQDPEPATVMSPMDGVYHRAAPHTKSGRPRKDAIL